jgi:uncharacterized protein YjbI with pentapeptide repeats
LKAHAARAFQPHGALSGFAVGADLEEAAFQGAQIVKVFADLNKCGFVGVREDGAVNLGESGYGGEENSC